MLVRETIVNIIIDVWTFFQIVFLTTLFGELVCMDTVLIGRNVVKSASNVGNWTQSTV